MQERHYLKILTIINTLTWDIYVCVVTFVLKSVTVVCVLVITINLCYCLNKSY